VRIFTRYILREITGYALLGGVLFTFILFMRWLLQLMELAVRGVATPADIVRLVGYLLPSFITFTLPMAVLIGILLGLSRLAADSEITAMRASGMGVLSFLRIVSILAFFCWGVGLINSLYIAPRAAQALLNYEADSKNGVQATIAVEPHVFYEGINNNVLYVQDVVPGPNGTAIWKHVFLADLSNKASPHIISANDAVVVSYGPQQLRMDLTDGSRHDTNANNPNEYDISTFRATELPIQTGQQDEAHLSRRDTPTHALPLHELRELAHTGSLTDARPYQIELYSRFAGPTACLVLMLVGVPLGMSSRRGGKGSGFVLTLALVFLYYILSASGIALARQGKLSTMLGVWGANIIFGVAGVVLIQQISRGGFAINFVSSFSAWIAARFDSLVNSRKSAASARHSGERRLRRALHIRFPLVLDEYVMGSAFRNFLLVITSLIVLFLIFTFFELIGDIVKNRTPLVTVGEYLFNLIPFIVNIVTPLSVLIAVLITFGTLNRTSELTAMKATGTSLYRVVAPVILLAAILSAGLFTFDETYLPGANRRQEALLSVIKNKPAQTFFADRKWMSGQTNGNGQPTRIFYYQYFDSDKNEFANLTVFEFQPGSFTLTRRIFAENARWDDKVNGWVLEDGWQRTFAGPSISSYQPFTVSTFPEIHEQPSYFKKEDRQSQEMSYSELSTYIDDLKQSGFAITPLLVQLYRKLAYPAITLIMAVMAIPFALVAGKRGSVAGLGTAIGVAICYWVIAAIFENLGDVNGLPAVLAAWSPDLLFLLAGSYLLLRTPT